ncbi:MAG: type II toxin-antitoxin system VapC family toxin [Gemmatimonadales bacterium]
MTIFVDTAALYALLVRTEDGHQQVATTFSSLLEEGRPLVTTNYVLLETVALLQRRVGLGAVRDFEERIVSLLTLRWITEMLHRDAMERLIRSDRRGLSLVDCSSFVVMEREGIAKAFTLDRDFAAAGFEVIPHFPTTAG